MSLHAALVLAAALLTAVPVPARDLHDAPPLERVMRVVSGETRADLSLESLVERLARADVVFLGETHLDETTHRVEHELYRRLLDARRGRVVLALEMFSRDAQPALDLYVAGEIDEATFVERAKPWGNYRTAYRRLIELARERRAPVVASNVPLSVRRQVAFRGEQGWTALSDEDRALVAAELLPSTDEYWRRVDNATRGHRGMMASTDRRYSTQSLWDNTMGESCALALDRHPGSLVLHVNGGFHSRWWDGTVRQLRERRPDATVVTVGIAPTRSPHAVDETRWNPATDYLVLATALAADVNEGAHSVAVSRDLRYRLHVPVKATPAARVPLLVWLPDDGASAEDELALWKARLGEEAAVAVVEPLHRERQEDLSLGGRWAWPDSFREDVMTAVGGLEMAWGYLLRNEDVDPGRVVVAGEGVGATVAAAASVWGSRWQGSGVALAPRRFADLRDQPVPLPEDQPEPRPRRAARVLVGPDDEAWWNQEAEDYRAVGFSVDVVPWPDDPWLRSARPEAEVRAALGLPAGEREVTGRAHVVLGSDTPLARNWARRLADRERDASGAAVAVVTHDEAVGLAERLAGSREVVAEPTAAAFADGERLPRAPGPFGGTTVVVLPEDLSETERAAWQALRDAEVLNQLSRFHRLRLATAAGERSVDVVLEELKDQNRRNVLLVPLAFAADGERMRAIRRAARRHEDTMTLHYRPGLGSALAAAE